ncbi:auxin efflux carrier [Schizophyllum amplum]|uniref:Auxin efflux carrier n=1 Tax=Schizophyllum amplum TaxID=97359 RepID=A0A550C982_9AGAR|nr:auxin efflux carrier [Auriculariopsis ampla]
MLDAGTLIWISLRPLLRLSITTSFGFAITKADIFPQVAARGAGQIILNVTLPCLMFSKIVPAFTPQNIHALGPLVFVAIVYEAMGMAIAAIVGIFFWVPHRFRYGLLVAGGWGNYGDIPTSVIMSICGAAPFNPSTDSDLGVAYVAAFILVFMITLFPLGGHKLIARDYVGPDIENDEVQEAVRRRRRMILYGWVQYVSSLFGAKKVKVEDDESHGKGPITEKEKQFFEPRTPSTSHDEPCEKKAHKHVAFFDDATTAVASPVCSPPLTEVGPSRAHSPEPTLAASSRPPSQRINTSDDIPTLAQSTNYPPPAGAVGLSPGSTPSPAKHHRRRRQVWHTLKAFLQSLCTPASSVMLISFPIALINPVKALFVEVDGTYMPSAPDGQPPLAFIMDVAQFVGAASVPLGLVCLGSALARLKVPRAEWGKLPLGAIFSFACGKMLLMPVLGVLMVRGMAQSGIIDPEDKVLQFVCIFFSCLPTATTQVFLTQVYSGTGTAEHLSAFLVPQYAIMFVSMVALTAYTLQLLF